LRNRANRESASATLETATATSISSRTPLGWASQRFCQTTSSV
jgi:hypothetical protein